ncbi:MAG: hypothetical protein SFW67_03845 [Myxococcaceae bacterium]|nr:hypothetical protein [Myxococcaceae bacterium]
MRGVVFVSVLAVGLWSCGVQVDAAALEEPAAPVAVQREALTAVDLLAPAPTQPLNTYDLFGQRLTSGQAFTRVLQAGLNPFDPNAYARLGMVHVTSLGIAEGKLVFDNAVVGDEFGFQRVFGFSKGLELILPELIIAIAQLNGRHTTNLRIRLLKDLQVGSTVLTRGTMLDTGLDVEAGALLPLGLRADFNITCAICHVTLDENGRRLDGIPNGDLNAAALVALTPNTASAVGRLSINVTDPGLYVAGTGKQVITSTGAITRLPDPEKIERAADDVVLQVPPGHFESSIDRISNTTQIPHVFTWSFNKFGFDGAFQAGPFRGLSTATSAVHSSEVNIIANAFDSALLDIDSQVYDGILLQNATDPALRLPSTPVRPGDWLRTVAPDPRTAELEKQVIGPGSGPYPNLKPTAATFNGLFWSPDTSSFTFGAGRFLRGANAMAMYQDSLVPPANKTAANQRALSTGAVSRGASVFLRAGCNGCHTAPFFTDNKVYPNAALRMNDARARSRLALDGRLQAPKLFAFDESVPVRAGARELTVPLTGITDSPTRLPFVTRDGGYKTLSLRALFLTAPYFHDGGAGVAQGALTYAADGSFTVADPNGLGIPGTLSAFRPLDAGGSLRAVVDSGLRSQVVARNRSVPALLQQNLDGSGHEFFVDATTGFTAREQADLVDFLLSLDDNPGVF